MTDRTRVAVAYNRANEDVIAAMCSREPIEFTGRWNNATPKVKQVANELKWELAIIDASNRAKNRRKGLAWRKR